MDDDTIETISFVGSHGRVTLQMISDTNDIRFKRYFIPNEIRSKRNPIPMIFNINRIQYRWYPIRRNIAVFRNYYKTVRTIRKDKNRINKKDQFRFSDNPLIGLCVIR